MMAAMYFTSVRKPTVVARLLPTHGTSGEALGRPMKAL
jgi:hypothetical protein